MRSLAYAALGERELALNDADELLEDNPLPYLDYLAARAYALTSRQEPMDARKAIFLLARALRHGYGVQVYRKEPDLEPLHKLPEFQALAVGLKNLGVPD